MRLHLLLGLALAATLLPGQMLRDAQNDTVTDVAHKVMWEDSRATDILLLSWEAAREHCDSLTFAGYDDWRLPTKEELLSTIDPQQQKQRVNGAYPVNSHFLHAHADVYWTADRVNSDDNLAWRVNFHEGKASWGAKRFEFHVRCIRSLTADH